MLQWLYTYVASVHSLCFSCFFRWMLQVCSSRCCMCFTYMLQVFFLDVAYVCNYFSCVFACVLDTCFECFSCFVRMLQFVSFGCFKSRLWMLCMLQWVSLVAAACCRCSCWGVVYGGCGKQGSVKEWRERAPHVRAAGADTGVRTRGFRPDDQMLPLPFVITTRKHVYSSVPFLLSLWQSYQVSTFTVLLVHLDRRSV
jgi:hypothetical protein